MAKSVAPSLDELLSSDHPAWLWDGERARIVWANGAGTAWFGADTLFDLLEIVFDGSEASVAAIKDLTNQLPRGEAATVSLGFVAAKSSRQLACKCYVHALADGRPGLLVCGETTGEVLDQFPAALQAKALFAFPLPLSVVSGDSRVLFANDASQDIFPADTNFEFAHDLIEKSMGAGLTSGLKSVETKHGKRDMRIIVRPLEKSDRLADSRFLVVFEDVTERRSLERALLTAAEGEANDNTYEPNIEDYQPTAASETDEVKSSPVARQQSNSNRPVPSAPPPADQAIRQTEEKADKSDAVPQIVSSTLNNLPQPLVILNYGGELLFANDAAVTLMGVKTWQEIEEVTTLVEALAALKGEDGEVSLFTAEDDAISLDVIISTFPWKDGPVYQATLSLGSDGENADNRRAPNTKTGSSKKNTDSVANPAILPEKAKPTSPQSGPHPCNPSDEELRLILDTATDGIVTLDVNGKICSFSAGAEALFGFRGDEVTGTVFSDLLAGKSCKVMTDYLDALSGSGLAAVFNDGREVEAKVKQGGKISLFLTIGRLETERSKAGINTDGSAAFCVVVRDITQWKKTEAELRQSKETAEKSNAQKSMFLANISHELRTPLNAIMGFSEVMRSERFGEIENEKYLAYANDIHASGGHLLALINDLLDLSKIEAGKLELDFTSVNLLNIIDEAMHLLEEQANGNRVLLRKSAANGLPNVVADTRSMKQILLNLLSNSVKFSSPGGQVIISAKVEENGELLMTIKDTGRGMNNEELQRALKPFQQVKSASEDQQTKNLRGTGLGLPLTKALVEANRARFTITSAPKKGTLVEIAFPTTRVLAD